MKPVRSSNPMRSFSPLTPSRHHPLPLPHPPPAQQPPARCPTPSSIASPSKPCCSPYSPAHTALPPPARQEQTILNVMNLNRAGGRPLGVNKLISSPPPPCLGGSSAAPLSSGITSAMIIAQHSLAVCISLTCSGPLFRMRRPFDSLAVRPILIN